MRILIFVLAFVCSALPVLAQNGSSKTEPPVTIIASPAQQKVMKPLLEAELKASADLQAAIKKAQEAFDTNPEVKKAREAFDNNPEVKKAREAFNAAIKAPQETFNAAKKHSWDQAHQFMADTKLSAAKYKPETNDKQELVFREVEKP